MKTKLTFVIFCCQLMMGSAVAQLPQYHVRLLTEQQGLNTADILDVSKDKDGFLWLLSLSSVQRYDGREARSFFFPETIRKVFVDSRNRKWVLGRSNIYLFKNQYEGFLQVPLVKVAGISTTALFDQDNTVYLLMSDGLRKLDETSMHFVPVASKAFRVKKLVQDIFSQRGYTIFAASADSIYSFNIKTNRFTAMPFKSIAYLLALDESDLLISDWNSRSYRVSLTGKTVQEIFPREITTAKGFDFIRFFGAIPVSHHSWFLSSNMGVVEYNTQGQFFSLPVIYNRGSPLNNISSIKTFFQDNEGTVFMTHADGLATLNTKGSRINYIRNYTSNNVSLPEIDVRCFAEDTQGYTWLGTINGIARLNMKDGSIKSFTAKKSGNNNYPTIRDLVMLDHFLIAGTGSKGIMILNTLNNEFTRPRFSNDSAGRYTASLLDEDFIWRLLRLQNGEVFIVGSKHCFLLDKHLQARLAPTQLPTGVSRSAAQDASGRIWHGTSIGLTCYDRNFQRLFSITDSFNDKRVTAFCEWKKDRMLVAGKGLYEVHIQNNRIKQLKKLDVLPQTRFVFCMQQDSYGDVWIGTDEGLYRYKPITSSIELFDAADNIQTQAFNSNGLYLAKNNRIFAGGKTGFNYFDPGHVQKSPGKLRTQVSSFSVGNNDSLFFKQSSPFTVPFFDRSIVINLSAPEYLRPFALRYRYTLSDKANKWIDNGNSNTIRMHNLPAGDYQFTGAASYDGINWYATAAPVRFTIRPPWWNQWWFRLLLLTMLALMIFLIVRYRKSQRRKKEYQQAIDYFANSGHEHSSTDDILWDITRNCISRLGFEDCVIYLVDADKKFLRQRAAYGAKSPKKNEIINPIDIPVGKGITGTVAASGKAIVVDDTSKDSRYIVDDDSRASELAVPIIHNEQVIGVIDSEHRRKKFFTKEHLETLQTIASLCASKISVAMAVEKMQHAIREVDEVNNKMLETKFLNLRLQMNPHFLFNSLSSIQHLIVSKQTNEAYRYLSIFSNFLRSILQYADKTLITVDEELKMLEMYIKLESIGMEDGFSYKIQVDEELETEEIFIPPLLLQPLVENAIWHGLQHKQGEKSFSVSILNNNDEQLLCIVEDNGVGRAHAAAIKKQNLHSNNYESKATALIHERLSLLQQQTGKKASIFTEDLNSNGNGHTGTRVTVIIPFYNKAT